MDWNRISCANCVGPDQTAAMVHTVFIELATADTTVMVLSKLDRERGGGGVFHQRNG